uniref:Uncharacterized protein n=1 Tax=Zea mays TaxID=4577 RepID=A0A804LS79_MAIZE
MIDPTERRWNPGLLPLHPQLHCSTRATEALCPPRSPPVAASAAQRSILLTPPATASGGDPFQLALRPGNHFGKVVSGIALLKKLEAVGSETGNPSYQVKIVDCGEVSNTNSQDPLKGDKAQRQITAVQTVKRVAIVPSVPYRKRLACLELVKEGICQAMNLCPPMVKI